MCAPGGLYSTGGEYVRDKSSSSLYQGYSHLSRFESGEEKYSIKTYLNFLFYIFYLDFLLLSSCSIRRDLKYR